MDYTEIIIIVVFLVLGCVAIGIGLLMRFLPVTSVSSRWYAQLVRWNIINANDHNLQLMRDVIHIFYNIQSFSLVGLGSAVVLYVVVIEIFRNTVKIIFSALFFTSQIFFAGFYLCLVIGAGVGFMLGVWQTRMSPTKRGVFYGDIRKRQLSDYRANLFKVFPIVLIFCTVFLTFFFFPHLGSTVYLGISMSDTNLSVANNVFVLMIIPVAMLIVLVILEIMMMYITDISRFSVTYNPVASQHADNMLRSIIIGLIQGYEFVLVGMLGFVQSDMIARNLYYAQFWHIGNRPFFSLYIVWLIFSSLIQISGFLITALQGRLGGSLSRWPWQRK